jgi:hypothetical protein
MELGGIMSVIRKANAQKYITEREEKLKIRCA